MKDMDFYYLVIEVENKGKIEKEEYRNLSLNDFEVIYGNETRYIKCIVLIKQDEFYEGEKK